MATAISCKTPDRLNISDNPKIITPIIEKKVNCPRAA